MTMNIHYDLASKASNNTIMSRLNLSVALIEHFAYQPDIRSIWLSLYISLLSPLSASDRIIDERITKMTYFRDLAIKQDLVKTDLDGPSSHKPSPLCPEIPQKISVYFTWAGRLGPGSDPYVPAYQPQ